MATAANFSRRGAAQLRAVQRAVRGMTGLTGRELKKLTGGSLIYLYFFCPLCPTCPTCPFPPFSLFSARAFKRHLMKIKTFYRSALAKSSNNLYLLALFPHGEFIAPWLTLTTRTHALAHTSSPARIAAQQIKCHEHHARHYSPNIRGIPRGNAPVRFAQPIFIYEEGNAPKGTRLPVSVLPQARRTVS